MRTAPSQYVHPYCCAKVMYAPWDAVGNGEVSWGRAVGSGCWGGGAGLLGYREGQQRGEAC